MGFGDDFEARVGALAKFSPAAICIDSAHAHTRNILTVVRYVRQNYPALELEMTESPLKLSVPGEEKDQADKDDAADQENDLFVFRFQIFE